VGDRPDRRHQELRSPRAGVGDLDRAAARRGSGGRSGECACAATSLVGRRRRGRLRVLRRRATSAGGGVVSRQPRVGEPVVFQSFGMGQVGGGGGGGGGD